MTIQTATYTEALEAAARLRAMYARTCWTVSIHRPLFAGDTYRVVAG